MKGVLIEKPEKSRNKIAKTYHSRFDNEKLNREAKAIYGQGIKEIKR